MALTLSAAKAKAANLSDEKLAALYASERKALLMGRTGSFTNTDDLLQFVAYLKKAIASRQEAPKGDDDLARKVAEAAGVSIEVARKHIARYSEQNTDSEWTGEERRGVRKPLRTAEDVAHDDGSFKDDGIARLEPSKWRQNSWGN